MESADGPPAARRPLASRDTGLARALTRALLATPVTPNQISLISILFAALAGAAMLAAPARPLLWFAAAACIQCRRCAEVCPETVISAGRDHEVAAYSRDHDRDNGAATFTVRKDGMKVLVHRLEGQTLAGRIVEAEAYQGPEDRAAHSYAGRRTARTEVIIAVTKSMSRSISIGSDTTLTANSDAAADQTAGQ